MTVRSMLIIFAGVLTVAAGLESFIPVARGQSTAPRVLGDGIVAVGSSIYILDTSNVPHGWKLVPSGSYTLPPVSVSSLISYDGFVAVTDSGDGWEKSGGVWTDLGTVPGTAVHQSTWGQVKARYR